MTPSPYDAEIDIILEKISQYKRVTRRKINKREVILKIRDALIKQNCPYRLISSKVVKILEDYDITARYIIMVLEREYKIINKSKLYQFN
jgi:hypothetical protein